MASPDLSPYIDLRFFDKDPQDVFDDALLNLQTLMPEWTPRESNIEVLLMEALALQVAEAIFAVNRLPGAVVMAMLQLYGVTPDEGAQPLVDVTFTLSDSLGHDIPAGTAVRLDLEGGLDPVVFETTDALAIPAGATTGTVTAVGDRYTAEANGVAPQRVELVDSLAYVDRVDTATTVADGRSAEEDEEWIERGVQRFARLSETLVLPRHFEAAALENPAIVRSKAIDNWNGVSGTPGSDGGHVTVAVYGDHAAVDAGTKTQLEADLEVQVAANLDVHIIDPTVTAVPVTVTVVREAGWLDVDVVASVTTALQTYLDIDTWDWTPIVRRNDLIAVISAADGVAYVQTLTTPAADQNLPGVAALVTPGAIAVTTV